MYAYSSTRKKDYPSSALASNGLPAGRPGLLTLCVPAFTGVFDAYKQAIQADIAQLEGRKGEFNAFKLDALEIGGTALFDRN